MSTEERTQAIKASLVEELDAADAELNSVLAGLAPHTRIYPEWTVKELLAHFAGWDEAVTSSLRAHAGGEELAAVAARGTDFYNEESVATRQSLSFEQVVRERAQARTELKAAIQAVPSALMDELLIFPWGGTGTAAQLVFEFSAHEREHARDIAGRLAGS